MKAGCLAVSAMSEEQLSALLAKLMEDAGLQEKLEGAAGLDAAMAIAKEAGFVISAEELQKAQAELSEVRELESVAGGQSIDIRPAIVSEF